MTTPAQNWVRIFGVDEPVRGDESEVLGAANEFSKRQEAARDVITAFENTGADGVRGYVEGPPGELLYEVIQEVGNQLPDLERVAGEAEQALRDHLTSLRDLREEADGAIARAVTAWDEREAATTEAARLRGQISTLQQQISGAAAETDVSWQEDQLTRYESSLESENSTIDARTSTLFAIYGDWDSEHADLRNRELELERATGERLDEIDLGELADPGFWEKVGSAIGNFVGGMIESALNCIEAFLTGDWATFFWELRDLLNGALLILGTIALFTGVGAPLFALSVAAFAVTAGLAVTQTPNPQTGETLGVGDVALSAVGVAFSAGAAFRGFSQNGFKLFTGMRNSSGQLQGGLFSTVRDVRNLANLRHGGQRAVDAATDLNMFAPSGFGSMSNGQLAANASYTTARVAWDVRDRAGKFQDFTDVSLGPIDTITGSKGIDGLGRTAGHDYSYNVAHTPQLGAQGTPLFGPPATPRQVQSLQNQLSSSPDYVVVPAA